tara:strand:- start:4243 stop:4650 length:408 start_codon:yes stop_codon:yes gene_type:complete
MNNIETKNKQNSLSDMMQGILRNLKSYAIDEESGKLSSSLLGDVAMTAIPGVGLAGTIGRKPLSRLIPSLAKKIGGKQSDWKKAGFSREILDEFGRDQSFFYNSVRLIEQGLPQSDQRYLLAKKAYDFYYNKIKK